MPTSDDELCTVASQLLRTIRYMALGTASSEGIPWITPLAHAWDDQDHFYWISGIDTVHSRNISRNPVVAITLFDSNPPDGGGQGLYALGRAEALEGAELAAGCEVYYTRRYPDAAARSKRYLPPKEFDGDSPRRLYRASIDSYSVLGPDGHPVYGDLVDHRIDIPFSTVQLGSSA